MTTNSALQKSSSSEIQKARKLYDMVSDPYFSDTKLKITLSLPIVRDMIKYYSKSEDYERILFYLSKFETCLEESMKKIQNFDKIDTFNINLEINGYAASIYNAIQEYTEKEYLNALGDTDYFKKLFSENSENIDALRTINRLVFSKTGSELIPLGGKFRGKYLIRIIGQEAFNAWKKTFELGIPCEELVKDSRGRYRTIIMPDDKVAVFTKYAGETLASFKGNIKEVIEIRTQQREIFRRLNEANIRHTHAHDQNFCVMRDGGKLIVRIIDFDAAYIEMPIKTFLSNLLPFR
jgi:hypothetical protein